MITAYTPSALTNAAKEIFLQHPLSSEDETPVSSEDLGILVRDIAAAGKSGLTMAALSVAPRQLRALCAALPKLKENNESENVSFVLSYNMNTALFDDLFTAWQNAPLSQAVLTLLAEHEDGKLRPKDFPLSRGAFGRLLKLLPAHDEYIRAVSKEVMPAGLSDDTLFSRRYSKTGLTAGTTLYAYCFMSHLMECPAASFEAEGDDAVARAISMAGKTRSAEAIIKNLLAAFTADAEGLLPFRKCFELIAERYPTAESCNFPADAMRSYLWWMRYDRLSSAFSADSDSKRMLFWTHYLTRCDVEIYPRQQLIVLEFKNSCVIESQVTGPLYIYEKDYFHSTVRGKLNSSRSGVKSWLSKSSKYLFTLAHNQNWESRVQQNAAQYLV